MNIQEDYVSFEIAKLLKEKGFDEPTTKSYYTEGFENPMIFSHDLLPCIRPDEFLCPTQQMAMKWLREKHNVHIEIRITNHSLSELIDIPKYYWVLFDASKVKWMGESTANKPIAFDTPEEAYANAIKYCLEKII